MLGNPTYGLIWEPGKDVTPYTTDDFKFLRFNVGKKNAVHGITEIKTLFIHPVGLFCLGSCPYCYENDTRERPLQLLTVEETKRKLDIIKATGKLSKHPIIRFTGGDPMLHPYLNDITNVFVDNLDKLTLRWTLDLLVPQDRFDAFIQLMDEQIKKDNVVNHLIAITVDLGSSTRYSKKLGIRRDELFKRAEFIMERYKGVPHVCIDLVTNFNKETDVALLLDELAKYKKKNYCRLVVKPVNDEVWFPPVDMMNEIITKLDQKYSLYVVNRKELAIENEYSSKFDQFNFDKNLFLELEEGVYTLHPFRQPCTAFNVACGFNQDDFFSCFYGNFRSKDVEDVLALKETNTQFMFFTDLPEQCLSCDTTGICMRCRRWKVKHVCSDFPYLKRWEHIIWDHLVQSKKYWTIKKMEY